MADDTRRPTQAPHIGGIGMGVTGRVGVGQASRWMQGGEKPRDLAGSIKRLLALLKGESRLFIAVGALVLLTSILNLSVPYIIGKAVDILAGTTGQADDILALWLMLLLAVYFSELILNIVNSFIIAGISQRMVKALRQTLYDKLQKLPLLYIDSVAHGELMSRLTNDVDNVSTTVSQTSSHLLASIITLTGSLVLMLVLSPALTLATLITVPLVFLLTKSIATRTRRLFKEQQTQLGRLNGYIEEMISGIDIIHAFGREQDVIEHFTQLSDSLFRVGARAQLWAGYLMPLMNVISNIGFAAVAFAGGYLAVKHIVSVGLIASFLGYSKHFSRPINDIANTFNTLQSAIAGSERVFEVLDEVEEGDDEDALSSQIKGEIEFDNVEFEYTPGIAVIGGISFAAPSGSHFALVGPTGAGKTTLVSLLTRFYPTTGGSISVDGVPISRYRRSALMKQFGVVLQDTYLFSGTIEDNIRYGRPDATFEQIVEAATVSNADAFIRRLPNGYKTLLTESGSCLSQGQRQLISIARVILAKPTVLILDEATSSVDTRTELHIQKAMFELMRDRTAFIIAHRLSTIREAHRILVIDGGRIVEEGTHEELMDNDGLYHNLYRRQFANQTI